MATAGPSAPGTMGTAAYGGNTWTTPDNAKVSDNTYTTAVACAAPAYAGPNGATCGINVVQLIKAGTIGGDFWPATYEPDMYTADHVHTSGGAAELWGNTLSVSDVNNSGFGVAIAFADTKDGTNTTYYLKATNFGFAIPAGATINGITTTHEMKGGNSSGANASVDYISMTVTYTPAASGIPIPVAMQSYRQRRV